MRSPKVARSARFDALPEPKCEVLPKLTGRHNGLNPAIRQKALLRESDEASETGYL